MMVCELRERRHAGRTRSAFVPLYWELGELGDCRDELAVSIMVGKGVGVSFGCRAVAGVASSTSLTIGLFRCRNCAGTANLMTGFATCSSAGEERLL